MTTNDVRLIAHLDMDAFYASVELLRYPELRGRPVVIGGGRRHQPVETVDPITGRTLRTFSTLRGYVGRGVITTATYAARKFGLHSAMGLMKAAQLAPDTVLLPVDFDAYRRYSRTVQGRGARDRAADPGQRYRRDLHRLDRCASARDGRRARRAGQRSVVAAGEVAQSIREAVRAATGLSCSIGVAPNKLLAKMAPSSTSRRPHAAAHRGRPAPHLAAAPSARSTASGRSRAHGSRRSASGRSASSLPPIRVARRALRTGARRVDARRCARARRAPSC
jgi:nucleotidyltransferase/DNA polymerase involved in DNA repair